MTRTADSTALELATVRRHHNRNERRTREFLEGFRLLERIDSWLQILLDCHAFAIDHHKHPLLAEYMEAYAHVASMAFANAESARLLLLRGLYGNAMASFRSLAAQNDLIIDLSLNEQSAKKWLSWRLVLPTDKSAEAKALRSYFRDSSVRHRVTAAGENSLAKTLYGVLSEPVHATAWASQFYSYESLARPGEVYVQYSPQYHPVRALSNASMLIATLPHLAGYFLQRCHPLFAAIDSRFDLVESRYFLLLYVYEAEGPKIRQLLERVEEAQDRLAAGEDFDAVLAVGAEDG